MNKLAILKTELQALLADLSQVFKQLDLETKQQKLDDCKKLLAEAGLWQQNPAKAQDLSCRRADLEALLKPWQALKCNLLELQELLAMTEGDNAVLMTDMKRLLVSYQAQFQTYKKQLWFEEAYDTCEVILSIFAGAGGTDAQDWTQMLSRMYSRWAAQHQIKLEPISQSSGDEAGLKSIRLQLTQQPFLYGRLKGEHGVHRLVRLSPFKATQQRQTSFAKVEVVPILATSEMVILKDNDLRFDFYKSSGSGGQSVNKTDSAVRVTHLPTNLVISIQNERSQVQNKDLALEILRSKLTQLQAETKAKTLSDLKGVLVANEWGSQIRNYVLHPYKQVKDLRTQYTTADIDKVLDGDLDSFLTAHIEMRLHL